MKMKVLTSVILVALMAGGCDSGQETGPEQTGVQRGGSANVSHSVPSETSPGAAIVEGGAAEVKQGDFVLQLVSGQESYAPGESVELKLRLKYTGSQEKVSIGHAASPFFFLITELTREVGLGYFMNQPLIYREMKRDEWLEEAYVKSAWYDESSPHKAFIQAFLEGESFPEGRYRITGLARFTLYDGKTDSGKDKETDYDMRTEPIVVEVR